ncbi:MAG TPA: TIGR02206 family membrane protein [Candidatus Eisenbacteria bacterium]|nr:TIGR02206 family membrane protein [Candidatus Eisenbacteria bacterium]
MNHPFVRFGVEHLAALSWLAALAAILAWWLRRAESAWPERAVRIALAVFLGGGLLYALIDSLPLHGLDWIDILPLHFCDLAVLLAVLALATKGQTVSEILYFWGLSGTLIAMLTPDVDRGFPDTRCVSFFALHGGVAISAVLLAFGMGARPRPRANLRVFAITNLYALIVGVIDFVADENFLYLRRKPSQPSLLDVMGPWPWYILAADVLAFVIFWALMLPFRDSASRAVSASASAP